MFASSAWSLFRRSSPPQFEAALATLTPTTLGAPAKPRDEAPEAGKPVLPTWHPARLALVHLLWDAGFVFPGGEIEVMRLTRPLGVSSAASLLIAGVGSGGPAISVTRNLGAWVTGLESDPSLLAAAQALVKREKLEKKITIKPWDPGNPVIAKNSHHHCLALEPLHGAKPEPILDVLARAVRSGGQLVLTELAAPMPLDPADPMVRRWAELERRDPVHVPAPVSVTRMLGRVGMDVRIAEDISQRHLEQATLGWRVMLRELDRKPTRQEAIPMVAEAELWMLRWRLIKDGRLRMMRWHAISTAPAA